MVERGGLTYYPLEGPRKPPATTERAGDRSSSNRRGQLLREAILIAAEEVGQDGAGTDGLVGYLKFLAIEEPKSFASLLSRVMPLQLSAPPGPVGYLDLDTDALRTATPQELEIVERVLARAARGATQTDDPDAGAFERFMDER